MATVSRVESGKYVISTCQIRNLMTETADVSTWLMARLVAVPRNGSNRGLLGLDKRETGGHGC
jgi:hypothetical protein